MHPLLEIEDLNVTFRSRKQTVRAVRGISFSMGAKNWVSSVNRGPANQSPADRSWA